jgi:hypothetical protein
MNIIPHEKVLLGHEIRGVPKINKEIYKVVVIILVANVLVYDGTLRLINK